MGNTKNKQKYFALERRTEKPLPTHLFVKRLACYFVSATSLVIFALGIGILGYHMLENLSLTDSFLNASMILGGMGPVNELRTETGKIFAGMHGKFGPEIIVKLSKEWKIPPNFMFIGSPGDHFPYKLADLGGVRLII